MSCDGGIILYISYIISIMHVHKFIFSSFCSSFPLLELDVCSEKPLLNPLVEEDKRPKELVCYFGAGDYWMTELQLKEQFPHQLLLLDNSIAR